MISRESKIENRKMKKVILVMFVMMFSISCSDILEPKPIDLLSDAVALNEPNDVPNVEIGLYDAFRPIIPSMVIAGDATADMLIFKGTFNNFRELCNKTITSANGSASALWASIYNTVYLANFILEKLPKVDGVKTTDRDRVLGTAHFLRGYAYFAAIYTYGGVPKVLTTDINTNRNIPRATVEDILALILDDYTQALSTVPEAVANAGFASQLAVKAALAKYYLYVGDWTKAEQYSTDVINSGKYELVKDFSDIVLKDFTKESIFEMGYTTNDDPGTNGTIGLYYLIGISAGSIQGRREMIPANGIVAALASQASGDRFATIKFKVDLLKGADNGWSVAKYGTKDEDNNNVVVFRLAEMYLIRAEARANQNNLTEAIDDINTLRTRANAPTLGSLTQAQTLLAIEQERVYELAYEGHRWYDLVRTGRASTLLPIFNNNWKDTYEVWPIPQTELQNNPSLKGHQNPGY